jgi:cytochrome c556
MKSFARRAVFGALLLVFTVGAATAQGSYNKAAFEKSMEEITKQVRVVLGTLIAQDWAKAQTESTALVNQAKSVHGLTPKVGADRIGEFQAHADSLSARAGRLVIAAKARDGAKATAAFGETVHACMSCHTSFRK